MTMVRLGLTVSPGLVAAVDTIAADLGISRSEALRRCFIVYSVAHKAVRDGRHIGVADDPKDLAQEFIGI